MVGSVDHGMAIGTTSVECEPCIGQLRCRRMPGFIVALVAEPGHARFQQLRTAGTMRLMAVHTIFHHRGVLPQERAAPFRMTLVTGLVGRAFFQQGRVGSPMRIMAVRAGDLSFAKRHMRGALHLRTAQLVALEADLHLGLLYKLLIPRQRLCKAERGNVRLHDLVAGDAGQAAGLVRTALPE